MSDGTPGPWLAAYTAGRWHVLSQSAGATIGFINDEADACRIAALPELEAALKAIMQHGDCKTGVCPIVLDMAQAALAKARGDA